jgi:hypothetical protein
MQYIYIYIYIQSLIFFTNMIHAGAGDHGFSSEAISVDLTKRMASQTGDFPSVDSFSTAATGPTSEAVTISVLNLVDLAGSERLSQAALEDADREKIRQKEVKLPSIAAGIAPH